MLWVLDTIIPTTFLIVFAINLEVNTNLYLANGSQIFKIFLGTMTKNVKFRLLFKTPFSWNSKEITSFST